jgi:hypothetical protein
MGNMASSTWQSVMVAVHNNQAPSTEEWDRYLELLREHVAAVGGDVRRVRGLTFTDGGAPNSVQRNQLRQILEGQTIVGSVVSDSAIVRTVVGFLGLFVRGGKIFSSRDWPGALTYLLGSPVPPSELVTRLRSMASEVGRCASLEPLLVGQGTPPPVGDRTPR